MTIKVVYFVASLTVWIKNKNATIGMGGKFISRLGMVVCIAKAAKDT